MEKINIMYLYSSKGFGGMVRNISLIVKHLNKDAFNITVVLLSNRGDVHSDIQIGSSTNVIFHRINEDYKLDPKVILKIKNFLKKYNIDILSCHGYKADFYGFLLTRFLRCNVKIITMAHGWVTVSPFKVRLYQLLDKFIIRFFDKIVLVINSQMEELSHFMINKQKFIVINNAVDPDFFKGASNRDLSCEEFGLDKNNLYIGFAGRLSKEKDIKTSLYALREVSRYLNNVKFIIAGDGPLKRKILKMVEKLKIEDKVILLGFQKEIWKVYKILDLYVSSSLKEGFPNNILEVQYIGIPCITTDIPGNKDIIKDRINGFLFKPRDYRTLSQKIVQLLEDKELAGRFAEQGQIIIRDNFLMQERKEKLENLYYSLVNKPF